MNMQSIYHITCGFFLVSIYYCLKVRPKNVYALVHDQALLLKTIAVALP